MDKEFVPYKQALELKELGFDEPCLMYYDYSCALVESGVYECKSPLYQQAFRWFREKYNLDSFINSEWRQTVKIGHYFNAGDYYLPQPSRLTYEEAELACLNK